MEYWKDGKLDISPLLHLSTSPKEIIYIKNLDYYENPYLY